MPFITSPVSAQTFNWKSVNIQGTGYVTGLIIHPDTVNAPNTIYARCDTVGAYRYDLANEKWIPILDALGVAGVESIAVDPAVANTVYAAMVPVGATNGDVLISTDKGTTWGSTGLSSLNVTMSPNAYYRGTTGERLMVDPQKTGLLYFGSRQNGLYKKNGAGAWALVGGGLPAAPADPGYTFVAFDKSSGTVGGATKTIYVGVWGSGVWRSTDAGSTWSNIGGGTGPSKAVVSSTGVLYVVYGQNEDQTGGGTGSVSKYSAGAWTNITPNANNADYTGITMDPTNANIIMVQTLQEVMFRSTNGGTSWTQLTWNYAGQPGYLGTPGGGYGSGVVIDPNNTSRAWHTNGYGAVRTDNITASPVTFNWRMLNFEELVTHVVRVPPYVGGADLLTGAADMIGFRNASRDAVPTAKIGAAPCGVGGANSMDYCYTQPQYTCFVGWDQCYQTLISGYSGNNGQSWSTFAGPGVSGEIAMSATNPQNMVWAPTNSAQIVYTTNGGATWTACSGITTSWQASLIWCSGKILAADRVNGNKFYYFDNANVYISTNGGASWTVEAGGLPTWRALTDIVVNPTTEGDVWMTFPPGDNTQAPVQAYHSTNGGATFSPVTSMDSALFMAFGKGPSSTNPTLYILGRVGGATKTGVYKSTDMGATWTLISDPSQNVFAGATCMEADMRTQNIVYVGGGGRGYFYGQASSGPPSPPTGLTATGGNTQISLAWTASTGATSYNVKRSTVSGSGYATVSSPTTTSYTNTGLTNGTTYYYVVTAVNSSGESGNGNQASATPSAPAPQAQIAAGTVTIDGVVDAAWSNATSYSLTKSTGTINGASDCSATWQGLWDATNLYILVNVTDDVKKNDSVAVYDDDCVEVYLDADHNGGTVYDANDRQLQFRWNDAAVHEGGSRATTGVAFAQADPTGTTYRMEIKIPWALEAFTPVANNIIGIDVMVDDDDDGGARDGKIIFNDGTDQAWTNPSLFGTGKLNAAVATPAAPTGLTATAGNAQVALSWTASTGATSYNVLRSTVSGYASVATGIAVTNYTNTGLVNGTTYYYVVTATNAGGTSGNSNQASATPAASSGNTHSGTWSCKGVLTGTPGHTSIYQVIPVASNQNYVASLWIKGTGSVEMHLGHGSWGAGIPGVTCNATGTWQQFTTPVFNTGSDTQETIYIQDDYNTAGTVYIDDVFMGVQNGTNVLPNPGFESGNVNWGVGAAFTILQPGGAAPPPAPTGLTATPGNTQAALSWTASSGATSYNVKRSTVSGSGYATVSSPTTTSYTNTGLTNGTAYYFVVTAVNANGESANSGQAAAIPISPNVHAGIWSTKAVMTSTAGFTVMANTVSVASNQNYVASVWIKGGGSVLLKVLAGNWGAEITRVQCNATGTWQQFTTPVIATGSNTQLTYVFQDAYGTAGTAYLDDTFVGVLNGTNTLTNPGFESGNVNWSVAGVFSVVQNP